MFAHLPIIREILFGAAQQGASLPLLCRELNIPMSDLSRSDLTVDFHKACKTWEVALKATGNPTLGLHLGTATTPSILGIVGHLMQNCRNLHEAFKQVCAFSALATDMFQYSMADQDEKTVLTFTPVAAWTQMSPQTARHAVDQAMSGCMNVFFLLSGKRLQPLRAAFTYRAPAQRERYTQLFGDQVRFSAPSNSLTFRKSDLLHPLQHYDQSLLATFQSLAKKQLRTRLKRTKFSDEVAKCIQFEFAAQMPSLEVLASHMNLSARTFQRKLSKEGLNYRQLSDKISRDIAVSLLSSGKAKVSDVARLMGYSEPSAFRRAFKRWTHSTPGQLKQKRTA